MKKIILTAAVLIGITATAQVKIGTDPLTLATGANFQVEGTAPADQFVILKSGGNVGIGTVAPTTPLDIKGINAGIKIERFRTANSAANLEIIRGKGTEAAPLPVVDNDALANIRVGGWANSTQVGSAARISFFVDGTVNSTTGLVPGRIEFSTAQDGGPASPLQKMVIKNDGFVGIGIATPLSKLHIQDGSITIADGSQALGRILMSDANGTGSWTPSTMPVVNSTAAAVAAAGDVYVDPNGGGLIVKDTAGVKWRITVSTTGVLTTSKTSN